MWTVAVPKRGTGCLALCLGEPALSEHRQELQLLVAIGPRCSGEHEQDLGLVLGERGLAVEFDGAGFGVDVGGHRSPFDAMFRLFAPLGWPVQRVEGGLRPALHAATSPAAEGGPLLRSPRPRPPHRQGDGREGVPLRPRSPGGRPSLGRLPRPRRGHVPLTTWSAFSRGVAGFDRPSTTDRCVRRVEPQIRLRKSRRVSGFPRADHR